ncbi:AAA family ATPase [Methylovulum miyakonense]|uniref:AAA family ATPase n=1 Tax=Methylovulum miyakonense TaxID=645578 RepID=UPI000378FD4C|nr:AAA family ATPase [Methylovulum miyakonense]
MITSFKTEQLGVGFDFDINLETDKQIYCFIGKNGIGKTQLLENMAKSLIYCHSIFKSPDSNLKYASLCREKVIYDKFNAHTIKLPTDIELNSIKIKDRIRDHWGFMTFQYLLSNRITSFVCDLPIIFIGAKNRGFTKNIDTNNIKILSDRQNRFVESFDRTLRYIDGEGLEHQEIADWFASRLIINPNFVITNQDKTQEAVTVLQLIDKLEPDLNLVTKNENGDVSLKITFSEGQLYINNIPLDKLSTGYVSIIKIFQEIIAGYSGWTNETNLNEVEGIVFIDEIEPHLHISWQTKIIGILREFFPKTTFYISTHSPLVLAGLKGGEGYELVREGDMVKTKTINHIENYFLNDIVTEFFGVDLNIDKIAHVDKEKQKKAKKLLLNLINSLPEEGQ